MAKRMSITTKLDIDKFRTEVGYDIHTTAVYLAPYDTGNLRRAITLLHNTSNRIKVHYSAFHAYYLHYLEEGLGPVKKHKGFIDDLTMEAVMWSLVHYFTTGVVLSPTKPTLNLKVSEHGAMFSEKTLLREMKYRDMSVTADDRRSLSHTYYRSKLGSNRRETIRGYAPQVKKLYNLTQNKNIDLFYTSRRLY